MIHIKGLTKQYKDFVALDSIDLQIAKGEFVYLVGPSGAGKTTLLNMIFYSDFPTEGDIYINRFCLKGLTEKQIPFYRRNVGMIFQDYKLLPGRTVYENVAFALRVVSCPWAQIRRKVLQVLELVGLQHKIMQYPHELSGGEQQRVCIARAIVNSPPILLADEPTGSLDPDTSWEIVQLLSKINMRHTTVVVATHNKGIVDDIRKRVIELVNGEIVRDQNMGSYTETHVE